MLIIKIELHSAITHKVTEIGRMAVRNDGGDGTRDNYGAAICKPGSQDYDNASHRGYVKEHLRGPQHVWSLVYQAIGACLGER